MTREELITTSRESGLEYYGLGKDRERFIAHITRFAALVRADEREACAGLAERRMLTDENKNRKTGYDHACKVIAAAIRARGNT